MLYIHQLTHLTPKMADLESVYMVRDLKGKMPLPLKEELLEESFCEFFVSSSELQAMEEAVRLVEPTMEQIKALLQPGSPLYEIINLQRSVQLLKEIPAGIRKNMKYLQQIQVWQGTSARDVSILFNQIPKLRTMEEKVQANEKVKALFSFLLRNPQFVFYAQDMVHEGPVAQMKGLSESMDKGFFFHVSLGEEYKKISFDAIKKRIPAPELEKVAEIDKNVKLIKRGVDAAYDANMRQVNFSVVLYSYVKWLSGK